MFRLAHISDIHLSPLPRAPLTALFSKRITGYLNWKINRKSGMKNDTLDVLVSHLMAQQPNHIAVTGDLVNLALDEEFARARDWLAMLGPTDAVSVVPGNHDAYVSGALERAIDTWRPNLTGDQSTQSHIFPYQRQRQGVDLIGLNSAITTAPFMATGLFDAKQERATIPLLRHGKEAGRFRIVMIHHPPFANATAHHKRLLGDDRFRSIIAEHGAELVLHGHTHVDSYELIEGPGAPVPVIGVPSASKAPARTTGASKATTGHHSPARYNLFDISGAAGKWSCSFREFGFPAHVSNHPSITELSSRTLFENGVFKGE